MAYFKWDQSYSVNVAEMDRQHKQLVNLINRMYEAIEQGRQGNPLTSAIREMEAQGHVINELVKYTSYHFSTEEKHMLNYDYPEYDLHKREHDKFIDRIESFKRTLHDGEGVHSSEIVEFLKKWLTGHIMGLDKKYGPYFNDRGLS